MIKNINILVFRFLKNWANLCIFNYTYVKQAAIDTGVSVNAQYSVNGEMNYNDAIKAGFMAPYTLNAPIVGRKLDRLHEWWK